MAKKTKAETVSGLKTQNEYLKDLVQKQRESIEKLNTAVLQLNVAMDSVLGAVAMRFGEKAGEDTLSFKIRAADVRATMEDYDVHAADSGEDYLVTVTKKPAKKVKS